MNKGFTSNALWPEGTCPFLDDVTTDTHHSEEAAEAVCTLLRLNGFGGNHDIYPIRTWVEDNSAR
jgi:hypothetical protein